MRCPLAQGYYLLLLITVWKEQYYGESVFFLLNEG